MAKTHRDKNFKILRAKFQSSITQEQFTKILKENFNSTEEVEAFFKRYNISAKKFLIFKDGKNPSYQPFKQRSNQRRKANQKGREKVKRAEKRAEKFKVKQEIKNS